MLIALCLVAQQIMLSEIMVNPAGSEYHNEYVEVYNAGNTAIDLSGWWVGDGTATDEILHRRGPATIAPGSYGVILDPSYFDNSTDYDSLLTQDIPIYVVKDSSIGSGGFSNSRPETVILFNPGLEVVDSLTYPIDIPNGFSLERRIHYEQNWLISDVRNGTPGHRNSVDRYQSPVDVTIHRESGRFRIRLINRTQRRVDFEGQADVIWYQSQATDFIELQRDALDLTHSILPDSAETVLIPDRVLPDADYLTRVTVSGDSGSIASLSARQLRIRDRFPLWLRLIQTAKPQLFEFQNRLTFALYVDSLFFQSRGGWKQIPINRMIPANGTLRLSKHGHPDAHVQNADIPFIYSKNTFVRMRYRQCTDSIEYHLEDAAFIDVGTSIIPRRYQPYNHLSEWIVNPSRQATRYSGNGALKMTIKNRVVRPNGHPEKDHLHVRVDGSDSDQVELMVFGLDGRKLHTLQHSTYFGAGEWVWDGKRRNGRAFSAGVYILVLRYRNRESGEYRVIKKPVIISR